MTAGHSDQPAPTLSPDGRYWWDGQAWQPMPAAPPPAPITAYCRTCGAVVDTRAAVCLNCGVGQHAVAPNAWPMVTGPEPKSPGIAVLLTILFPGAGHLYIGNSSKGTPHLVANAIGFVLALTIILLPITVIIWIVTLCMTVGGISVETERQNMSRFGRPS